MMSYSDGDAVQAGLSYKIQTVFSGVVQQMGWAIYLIGLVFTHFFIGMADVSFIHFRGEIMTVKGTTIGYEETNASTDETPVMATHFSFTTSEGTTVKAVSYATGDYWEEGAEVTVEYPAGKPHLARIKGMRNAFFGPGFLFILIFPLVGFLMLVGGLAYGVKGMMLLGQGRLTHGSLSKKRATNSRVNDLLVWELTFAYKVDGQDYTTSLKTHMPEELLDEREEALIYKPADPSFAVMVDSLPGHPHIDRHGYIRPKSGVAVIPVLILPVLTMLMHLVFIL